MAKPDYRAIGPVSSCPACEANAFQTILSLNQETFTPEAWFLDVECAQCGALLKMASPVDQILREPAMNVSGEDDE